MQQLFCHLTCWFTLFCYVRTFSNSLETVLVLASVYFWPFEHFSLSRRHWRTLQWSPRRQAAMCCGFIAIAVRPTSVSSTVSASNYHELVAKHLLVHADNHIRCVGLTIHVHDSTPVHKLDDCPPRWPLLQVGGERYQAAHFW